MRALAEEVTERELLAAVVNGDQAARQEFVERYWRLIYAAARGALQAEGFRDAAADAEDVTQDVFYRLLQNDCAKLRAFRGRARLSTWLHVVAVNVSRDHARRLRRLREVYRQSESGSEPEGIQDNEEQLRFVEEVIATFRWEDQQLFELRYRQNLAHKEIGRLLGNSAGAVQVRLSRLKERIRREARRAGLL